MDLVTLGDLNHNQFEADIVGEGRRDKCTCLAMLDSCARSRAFSRSHCDSLRLNSSSSADLAAFCKWPAAKGNNDQ